MVLTVPSEAIEDAQGQSTISCKLKTFQKARS